jgi:predicted molibdopterin-dependent oxidoreductase YjgC
MGITQHAHGTDNARSLINLALLTGQLGRPGCGISPLRGQNNVQGCGDAGCIPDSLPGYQPYSDDVAAVFEESWGAGIPRKPGIKATDMVEQIADGTIRAMYIVGENPLLSEPNLAHAEDLFRRLEFLVVQDLFLHETALLADVVLPACSFAEKDGTFTNSERRVQRVRPAIPPVGESRPDWAIIADLARRMAPAAGVDPRQFAYASAAEVFTEMTRLTPQLRGLSYARLEREGGIQWPCPTPDHPGTRYLYADRFPRGLGKFVPVRQASAAAELPDASYPLVLNTGRVLYHWHGGTITRRVSALVEQMREVPVLIHPADANACGVTEGDDVAAREADRSRRRHRRRAAGIGFRPIRQVAGERRQLPHEQCLRRTIAYPGIQGLRGSSGEETAAPGDYRRAAHWRAWYVMMMSAPARRIAVSVSSMTRSASSQPRSMAAISMAYSPLTL